MGRLGHDDARRGAVGDGQRVRPADRHARRYAAQADRWLANVLGANAWGLSLIVGDRLERSRTASSTSWRTSSGSLDGTGPVLAGRGGRGPNGGATTGSLSGMRACPANGVDAYAAFNGKTAQFKDNVAVVLEHRAGDRPDGDLAARVRPPGGRDPVVEPTARDLHRGLRATDRVCDVVRRWLAVTGTVLLIAAWWTLPVAAASPSPAPGVPDGLQVWLDSDSITPDAPPGGILQVGYTFWDTRVGDFPNVEGPYVKLHPAKGKAAPSEAIIEQGLPGSCPRDRNGAGGWSRQARGGAAGRRQGHAAHDRRHRAAAGRAAAGPDHRDDRAARRRHRRRPAAFPLTVDVNSRGLYDQSALPLPDDVVAVARHPGGPGLSTGDLRRPATWARRTPAS